MFYAAMAYVRVRFARNRVLPFVAPAAEKLGWEVRPVAMDDGWTQQESAHGAIEGVPARLVRMDVNRQASHKGVSMIPMAQVAFPIDGVFVMSRALLSSAELAEVERDLPHEHDLHPDLVVRHGGTFPELLERPDVLDVITRLQGAYPCIKLKAGWFSVGGQAMDFRDVDIDLEHLGELARVVHDDRVVLTFEDAVPDAAQEASEPVHSTMSKPS